MGDVDAGEVDEAGEAPLGGVGDPGADDVGADDVGVGDVVRTSRTAPPGRERRVRPEGLAEAADAVATAAGERRPMLVRGAGTCLEWGGPVDAGAGLVLETAGLDRMLRHAPEDWTVGVEAGMPLARLQELLAPAGQWLPVDAPSAAHGATLGGLLACGDTGPQRLKHGSLSDLVIGATLVLPDGTVARTGGDVIKNVAGYDLAKLTAGSLGAFGLVARLNLRVHPLPAASATLVAGEADAEAALGAARAVMRSPLEPVAVEWDGRRLLVRFHGTAEGVAERVRRARELPGLAGADALGGEDEETAWRDHGERLRGAEGETVLRAATRPARLPPLVRRLHELARETGVRAELLSGVAQGLHTAVLRGGDAKGHAACLDAWRAEVHAAGGTVTLRRRRAGVDDVADAWGPAPPAAAVLRALKRQFDPAGLCAPGRFAPWF